MHKKCNSLKVYIIKYTHKIYKILFQKTIQQYSPHTAIVDLNVDVEAKKEYCHLLKNGDSSMKKIF